MKWFLPSFLVLLAAMAGAQEADSKEPSAVEAMVRQLGDPVFEKRQAATKALMGPLRKNPDFAAVMERYADHEDPEIRARIAELTRDLPLLLAWIDPAMNPDIKSPSQSSGILVLSIMNHSPDEVFLYWIDWQGALQSRGSIQPGKKRVIAKTYVGHVWMLTDAKQKPLGLYLSRKAKNSIIRHTGQEGKEAP